MLIKIHKAYRNLVSLVDKELIGKEFEEGIKKIKINPNFFKGELKEEEAVIKILKEMENEDAIFNIVGKKSIETALKAGIISKEGIIKIQHIPIALGLL